MYDVNLTTTQLTTKGIHNSHISPTKSRERCGCKNNQWYLLFTVGHHVVCKICCNEYTDSIVGELKGYIYPHKNKLQFES